MDSDLAHATVSTYYNGGVRPAQTDVHQGGRGGECYDEVERVLHSQTR